MIAYPKGMDMKFAMETLDVMEFNDEGKIIRMTAYWGDSNARDLRLMETMPLARIHGPGEVRIDDVDLPAVGPADVLVQVVNCGICGSDISYTRIGGLPGAPSPMPIGHEFSGTIAAVGEEVSGLNVGTAWWLTPRRRTTGSAVSAVAVPLLHSCCTETPRKTLPASSPCPTR